jgi:phage terminase large subunit
LIYADSARPEMIAEIKKAGYKIVGVSKYAGSVKDQIQNVQQYDLYVNGKNITREIAGYMWKKDKE